MKTLKMGKKKDLVEIAPRPTGFYVGEAYVGEAPVQPPPRALPLVLQTTIPGRESASSQIHTTFLFVFVVSFLYSLI